MARRMKRPSVTARAGGAVTYKGAPDDAPCYPLAAAEHSQNVSRSGVAASAKAGGRFQERSADGPEGWTPFTDNGRPLHCAPRMPLSLASGITQPRSWTPFSRKETTDSPAVGAPNARRRGEHPTPRAVGQLHRSAQRQDNDYGCCPKCHVYEDHQCEHRHDQWKWPCMSGISQVATLLSGVCISDRPIVPRGDLNTTPDCVGSVSTSIRKANSREELARKAYATMGSAKRASRTQGKPEGKPLTARRINRPSEASPHAKAAHRDMRSVGRMPANVTARVGGAVKGALDEAPCYALAAAERSRAEAAG
jgi:hypothetical protein